MREPAGTEARFFSLLLGNPEWLPVLSHQARLGERPWDRAAWGVAAGLRWLPGGDRGLRVHFLSLHTCVWTATEPGKSYGDITDGEQGHDATEATLQGDQQWPALQTKGRSCALCSAQPAPEPPSPACGAREARVSFPERQPRPHHGWHNLNRVTTMSPRAALPAAPARSLPASGCERGELPGELGAQATPQGSERFVPEGSRSSRTGVELRTRPVEGLVDFLAAGPPDPGRGQQREAVCSPLTAGDGEATAFRAPSLGQTLSEPSEQRLAARFGKEQANLDSDARTERVEEVQEKDLEIREDVSGIPSPETPFTLLTRQVDTADASLPERSPGKADQCPAHNGHGKTLAQEQQVSSKEFPKGFGESTIILKVTRPFFIHMAKHEPREMEHAAAVTAAVPRDSWEAVRVGDLAQRLRSIYERLEELRPRGASILASLETKVESRPPGAAVRSRLSGLAGPKVPAHVQCLPAGPSQSEQVEVGGVVPTLAVDGFSAYTFHVWLTGPLTSFLIKKKTSLSQQTCSGAFTRVAGVLMAPASNTAVRIMSSRQAQVTAAPSPRERAAQSCVHSIPTDRSVSADDPTTDLLYRFEPGSLEPKKFLQPSVTAGTPDPVHTRCPRQRRLASQRPEREQRGLSEFKVHKMQPTIDPSRLGSTSEPVGPVGPEPGLDFRTCGSSGARSCCGVRGDCSSAETMLTQGTFAVTDGHGKALYLSKEDWGLTASGAPQTEDRTPQLPNRQKEAGSPSSPHSSPLRSVCSVPDPRGSRGSKSFRASRSTQQTANPVPISERGLEETNGRKNKHSADDLRRQQCVPPPAILELATRPPPAQESTAKARNMKGLSSRDPGLRTPLKAGLGPKAGSEHRAQQTAGAGVYMRVENSEFMNLVRGKTRLKYVSLVGNEIGIKANSWKTAHSDEFAREEILLECGKEMSLSMLNPDPPALTSPRHRSVCCVEKWKWKGECAGGEGPICGPPYSHSIRSPILTRQLRVLVCLPAAPAFSGFLTIFLYTMKVQFSENQKPQDIINPCESIMNCLCKRDKLNSQKPGKDVQERRAAPRLRGAASVLVDLKLLIHIVSCHTMAGRSSVRQRKRISTSDQASILTYCWCSTQNRARGTEAMQSVHRVAGSSEGWIKVQRELIPAGGQLTLGPEGSSCCLQRAELPAGGGRGLGRAPPVHVHYPREDSLVHNVGETYQRQDEKTAFREFKISNRLCGKQGVS
ncbi:hypothetical protein E5288_WYG020306 [Bos mutus]|uniref:Uncharacterized protein n=1 Tax=Bos mutus TaxID=72004 RepID=A0A6B0S9S5_9CETA|nr:hypothetical protein [Bos mutus]